MSISIRVAFKSYVDDLEVNSGELITEQSGYISPQRQIEDMILAGRRLAEGRGQFDWPDGENIDESASDPTRSLNYDSADAFQDSLKVMASLAASQAAAKASQAAAKVSKDSQALKEVGDEKEKA
nr:MAG: hypothetical protein [Microviridae sp.]